MFLLQSRGRAANIAANDHIARSAADCLRYSIDRFGRRACLAEPWSIDRIASEARVSVQTIQRHVRDATGMAPGGWLQGERVVQARELLEETCQSPGTDK
ncbi:hypothetical protein EPK99_22630 [Neorhizobium lilium]|uniref:HTH araC/xylS-type domain-containing protein n=1 Tax=Neorhizobium lilium TaxID=2503024 RepID=A0A444LAR8_9HYPH|nr:hypothetical protein [Neorhizobium lilium]RWX74712.1 hypothetical protein EPK99_22630 [Neorhizobium lilium]